MMKTTLLIKNIPNTMSNERLKVVFSEVGFVDSASVGCDDSGASFGIVRMYNLECLEKAVSRFDQTILDDKVITVSAYGGFPSIPGWKYFETLSLFTLDKRFEEMINDLKTLNGKSDNDNFCLLLSHKFNLEEIKRTPGVGRDELPTNEQSEYARVNEQAVKGPANKDKTMECAVCCEQVPMPDFIVFTCGHQVCKVCFEDYVHTIDRNLFLDVLYVDCMFCKVRVAPSFFEHLLNTSSRRLLQGKIIDMYMREYAKKDLNTAILSPHTPAVLEHIVRLYATRNPTLPLMPSAHSLPYVPGLAVLVEGIAIRVPASYEVFNGLSGMMRDVVVRLCAYLYYGLSKICTVMGMSQEHLQWTKHNYFFSIRKSHIQPAFSASVDINRKIQSRALTILRTYVGSFFILGDTIASNYLFLDVPRTPQGVYAWTCRIFYPDVGGALFMFGISSEQFAKCKKNGTYVYVGSAGFTFSRDNTGILTGGIAGVVDESRFLSAVVPNHSFVSLELDVGDHTLAFVVNGQKTQRGITGLPSPIVFLMTEGGTYLANFTSVSYRRLPDKTPTPLHWETHVYAEIDDDGW